MKIIVLITLISSFFIFNSCSISNIPEKRNLNDTSSIKVYNGNTSGMDYTIIDYYILKRKKYSYRVAFSFPISKKVNFYLAKAVYNSNKYQYTVYATDKDSNALIGKVIHPVTQEDRAVLVAAIDRIGSYNNGKRLNLDAINELKFWTK